MNSHIIPTSYRLIFSGEKPMKTTAPEVCIDLVGNTTGYESVKVLGSLVKDADRVDEGWDLLW